MVHRTDDAECIAEQNNVYEAYKVINMTIITTPARNIPNMKTQTLAKTFEAEGTECPAYGRMCVMQKGRNKSTNAL